MAAHRVPRRALWGCGGEVRKTPHRLACVGLRAHTERATEASWAPGERVVLSLGVMHARGHPHRLAHKDPRQWGPIRRGAERSSCVEVQELTSGQLGSQRITRL